MPARVLVLNRGEIALRACHAARQAGLSPVLFAAGGDLPHRLAAAADAVHPCSGTTPGETFLDLDVVGEAIRATGATWLYPGYGFHSENAALAETARAAGARFIGPSPAILEAMADKGRALAFAEKAGLATLRLATDDPPDSAYPVLVKAVQGGGGRGNAVVRSPAELAGARAHMMSRAREVFGDERVVLERYLPSARHVELQVFGANGSVAVLGTRDCSVQRRFQKVIEEGEVEPRAREALARVTPTLEAALGALGYEGAGTLEFLWDANGEALYFLEMNTRIQVEHPVTEVLLGEDLVALQFAVAAGRPVDLGGLRARSRGHAIEVRLYAEKHASGAFLPDPGEILHLDLPALPFCRWDNAYSAGDTVAAAFDPMIAKLVTIASDRAGAIARARACLSETAVHGVRTNVPLLLAVLDDPAFAADRHDVTWLERELLPGWAAREDEGARAVADAPWADAEAALRLAMAASSAADLTWKRSHRR
jgi:acetyl/propionyl-CoA carboxylase alpha subunit